MMTNEQALKMLLDKAVYSDSKWNCVPEGISKEVCEFFREQRFINYQFEEHCVGVYEKKPRHVRVLMYSVPKKVIKSHLEQEWLSI